MGDSADKREEAGLQSFGTTAHRLVCTIFCSFCCTTGITLPADPGPPMRPLTPLKFALAPCGWHTHGS